MKHYTCDVCTRTIGSSERRFRACIYIESADLFESEEFMDVADDVFDDMDRLDDILENSAGGTDDYEEHRLIFDLCESCKNKYLADPLFRRNVHVQKLPFGSSRN